MILDKGKTKWDPWRFKKKKKQENTPSLPLFLLKNKHVLSGYLCQPCAKQWEYKTNKPWFLPSRSSQSGVLG